MKIHIKGGRLIDPKHGVDAAKDLYVAAGKVVGIGEAPAGYSANRVIDAAGLVVCPRPRGPCAARLREPGLEYLATLESEMAAAIAGGVTSLACPPDTDPPARRAGARSGCSSSARKICIRHGFTRSGR
jgi:dihydroorotase